MAPFYVLCLFLTLQVASATDDVTTVLVTSETSSLSNNETIPEDNSTASVVLQQNSTRDNETTMEAEISVGTENATLSTTEGEVEAESFNYATEPEIAATESTETTESVENVAHAVSLKAIVLVLPLLVGVGSLV